MSLRFDSKRITTVAILASCAIIVHALEGLLPPIIAGLPIKMGLANIFTLYALIALSPIDALFVTLIRCTLGSLIGGSVTGMLYSLTGGLFSWLAMSALLYPYKKNRLTEIGVSVIGAWVFNFGQLGVGVLLNGTAMLVYFPVLELFGILTGILVGFLVQILAKRLR